MPARYPARKLRFTTQAFESLEKSEAAEAITLKTLRKAANAIDCELVYALVPKSGSLDAMIKQQAKKRARKTMAPVAHTMLLESQGTHTSENRINEIAEQLADSPKPSLWQD
jgi:predicted DNA-binding mobile mystery protein A